MQLAESEPLCVADDDQRCVRYIDADLDHRRGNENIDNARSEGFHDGRLLVGLQLAMEKTNIHTGKRRREPIELRRSRMRSDLVRFVDKRADHEHLSPCIRLLEHSFVDLVIGRRSLGDRCCCDRAPPGGKAIYFRDLQIAVQHHRKRPWNRRRRHQKQIRDRTIGSCGAQLDSLLDSEPMLFVNHRKPEVVNRNIRLNQRLSSESDVNKPLGKPGKALVPSDVA